MTAEQLRFIFEKKYNRSDWYTILRENFNVSTLLEKPADITSRIKANDYSATALELGSFTTLDGNHLIGLYEIEVPEKVQLHRNRKGLRDLLNKIYRDDVEAALIVFIQGNKWRFSYVSEITVKNKATGKRETKSTDAKRFTYLLGEGERTKTAADRFARTKKTDDLFGGGITLAALEEAFNVEKMSKAFFNEYRRQYGYFTAHITGEDENGKEVKNASPFLQTTFKGNHKEARDFVKKMLGRIVFLYFLEKKGWLGVPAGKKWGDGDENFLSNLFTHCNNKSAFYSNVLVPLFFATLNTERKDDYFKIEDTLFTKGNYSRLKMPYLNGGLFEEDETNTQLLVFPEELFAGLFTFFDQYNFTVYEDSPDEHTVAVDPEMLGHIFENLLEDNKDKGAFYTPKEIVHYMCRESLIEYLYTKLNPQQQEQAKENVSRGAIEKFVLQHEAADIIEYEETILTALRDVKICDPAIGSGAFPMGLLMEIFYLVDTMFAISPDLTNKLWKLGNNNDVLNAAKVKEQIIQNSIYGVDIEKGAVDIARLRFWLSLVVDEDTPKPLPNLDYKIVVGNSLLSKFEDEVIDIDWDIKPKNASAVEKIINDQQSKLVLLSTRQYEYFQAGVDKYKQQIRIRDLKIDILINQVTLEKIAYEENNKMQHSVFPTEKEMKREAEITERIRDYNRTIHKLEAVKKDKDAFLHFFDWKLDFPEVMNEKVKKSESGFDIVIGNPPYVPSREGRIYDSEKEHLYKNYSTAEYQINTYGLFIELSYRLLKKDSLLSLIIPNYWLSTKYDKALRHLMFSINETWCLLNTYSVFENAVVDTIILLSRKSRKKENYFLQLFSLSRNATSIEDRLHELKTKKWSYSERVKIDTKHEDHAISFNKRFFSYLPKGTVGDYFNLKFGVKLYQVGKGKPPQTKTESTNKKFESTKRINEMYFEYLRARNIQRFYIKKEAYFIFYGPHLAEPRNLNLFMGDRILLQRIVSRERLDATFYDKDAVCNTDVITIKPKEGNKYFSVKFLLGLLCSKFCYAIIKSENINIDRDAYPKINTKTLESFPLPNYSRSQSKITELIDKILQLKVEDSLNDIDVYEKEIDLIVYKLYSLTYEEACIVEGNTEWMSKEAYDQFSIND